jgi:hypothetical protein
MEIDMSGDFHHRGLCAGRYGLVDRRTVNGRPVWRHESRDRWLVHLTDMGWSVQEERHIGLQRAHLYQSDCAARSPFSSTTGWHEFDSRTKGWVPLDIRVNWVLTEDVILDLADVESEGSIQRDRSLRIQKPLPSSRTQCGPQSLALAPLATVETSTEAEMTEDKPASTSEDVSEAYAELDEFRTEKATVTNCCFVEVRTPPRC